LDSVLAGASANAGGFAAASLHRKWWSRNRCVLYPPAWGSGGERRRLADFEVGGLPDFRAGTNVFMMQWVTHRRTARFFPGGRSGLTRSGGRERSDSKGPASPRFAYFSFLGGGPRVCIGAGLRDDGGDRCCWQRLRTRYRFTLAPDAVVTAVFSVLRCGRRMGCRCRSTGANLANTNRYKPNIFKA